MLNRMPACVMGGGGGGGGHRDEVRIIPQQNGSAPHRKQEQRPGLSSLGLEIMSSSTLGEVATARSWSSYPFETSCSGRLLVGLQRPKPHTKSGQLSHAQARLEASERFCSANHCRDALELALVVLEQLTDLLFVVARHLIQPADDVTHKRLDRAWRGAVRRRRRCARNCSVDSRFCERSTIASASGWLHRCACAGGWCK